MPVFSSDARFLGIDLSTVLHDTRKAWERAQRWPLFAWLTPSVPVHLFHADGSQSHRRGDQSSETVQKGPGRLQKVEFTALELPPEMVLVRTVQLPAAMASNDIENALALQARTFSPFPLGDMVWIGKQISPDSLSTSTSTRHVLALASRKQVDQYLNDWRVHQGPQVATPELWVAVSPQGYAALPGWGLERRMQSTRRKRNLGYALLLSALALLLAIAVTPTLKLRMRALQAAGAYEEVVKRTAPVVRDREQVVLASTKLNALSDILSERIDPLRVIDTLTQVLPDDSAVQVLNLSGAKVSLNGLTSDTASLMQRLGQQPGIREVKAPAAATRVNNSAMENFSIEFMVDPQTYGVSDMSRKPAESPQATAPAAPASAPGAPLAGVTPASGGRP
jgi:general secretion pathway protein L